MNINFEQEFINPINANVSDKYLDEYLQTSRYNLLLFNNLNNDLYVLQNNHIVNKNKHFFHFIDNVKKETLQYQLKQLILKQRKLYQHFIHYYSTIQSTAHSTAHINTQSTTQSTTIVNYNTQKSIRASNLKSKENTRELKIQQNLLHSNSIIHKINAILTENTVTTESYNTGTTVNIESSQLNYNYTNDLKIDLYNLYNIESKVNEPSIKNLSLSRRSVDNRSIESKRSVFTISSRKSTDSNKSSDSNTSKKSYKINRPEKQESQTDQKKMKFTKFFIKK
jgi:hypothetical protein